MKLRISDYLLCTLCILCGYTPARAEVLAQGTAESYWVATIRKDSEGKDQSLVQYRPINSAAPWKTIARVNGSLRQLAHQGKALVALLDNGEWMLLRDGSSSTGTLPEDGSRLIHLAGDNQTLWAVGVTGSMRRPTTAGATQPAATMPANTRLLYRLERGSWVMLGRLPNEAQEAEVLSLGAVDQSIMLAVLLDEGRVETYRFEEGTGRWHSTGAARVTPAVTRIKLLSNLGRPTLWAAEPKSAGGLSWQDGQWTALAPLAVPADKLGDGAQDVTVAGRNSIRLIVEVDGKISEYSFDRSGGSQGLPVSVPAPTVTGEPAEYEWLTGVAAAALLIVLMNTMRRREPVTPETLAQSGIVLAAYGRRLAAGSLDALPVIGTMVIVLLRIDGRTPEELEAAFNAAPYPLYISLAIYVLHTLVCELLWGWSIGKRLFGLRVIMIDGTAPTPRAIILRNLLRVLDVMMMFVPLLIMVLSPLRQRIGDIVAETIVIKDEGERLSTKQNPDPSGMKDEKGETKDEG